MKNFFESKCYELLQLKDIYLDARKQFLKQAEAIKEGDTFYFSCVAQKAVEMNVAFKKYSEDYRTLHQFAYQLDNGLNPDSVNEKTFEQMFDTICGKELTIKEPEKTIQPHYEDAKKGRVHFFKDVWFDVEIQQKDIDNISHGIPSWVQAMADEIDKKTPFEFEQYKDYEKDEKQTDREKDIEAEMFQGEKQEDYEEER